MRVILTKMAQSIQLQPDIEVLAITILKVSQSIGHTFMRIDNGNSEVISGVVEEASSTVMRDVFGPVEDGITQALNFFLHVELCSDEVVHCSSCNHALKEFKVLLHGIVAVNTLNSDVSLFFHFISGGVAKKPALLLIWF